MTTRRNRRLVGGGAAVLLASAAIAVPARADNPIITDVYTADPAALVHDGTLYVYTGHDEAPPGGSSFQMFDWYAFSSTDVDTWTNHGPQLSLADFAWADANAWASEVEQGPDGRFYWYTSVDGNTDSGWMNIGVAVGDSPTGPFTDAIGGPLISDDMANSSALNIDPTVFIDDDGQIYMYWGSFWEPRMVLLDDTMVELDSAITTPQGLDEFWEAPWLFERDGIYYMAYASNANIGGDGCVTSSSYACIRYATADDPAGPWTHQGIVLDQVSSTTNHPAIVEYPENSDEWWMVYHTADAPGGGDFRRSVAVDPVLFNPDGTMQKVVQTVGPSEPDANLASSATASASYTSSWETVTAINDGIDPPSSNDTVNPRWGTWPEVGEQWVELSWADPVTVASSEMYFFQDSTDGDGNGVKRPESWQIEYWDGDSWAAVTGASGYPTALDQYNSTSFDEVTTTGLRAVLQTRTDAEGVGMLEWQVFGEDGDPGGGEDVDHAPGASPVCSYTSSWEDCSAINDDIDPPSSNDTVNPRWGTWPEEGEQWADLRWSSAVALDEADVYFFDDGQGIDLPASWELQYWDGSAYVDVANASGYPTAADQYNTVTFDEVTTTRLRVVLQSAADSVGLLEINAWGPQ